MKVLNPYTNELIANVDLCDTKEIETIISKGKSAKEAMASLSSKDRSHILIEIIEGLEMHYHLFISSIIKESGKPYRYAKAEVDRAIQTFTIAAEETKRLPHELLDLDQTEKGVGLQGEVVYFPKGLIFGISPFNFPLNLAVHKIAPAIASGCPIIFKPSSKTTVTMMHLADIINETGLPEGGFQLVNCTRENGNKIIEDERVDLLSFTGSPAVGWKMKAAAGKKKVILELGGNAAAIVCDDANMQLALEELLVGGFAYSGQVCIHTQRIYVHKTAFDDFKTKFIENVEQLKNGDPMLEETDFSLMIDDDNAARVEKWVAEAIDKGATLLTGGKKEGGYYAPTVLTNVPKGLKVLEEEVFGPVVVLEPYDDLQEAIDQVNDSRWGLQASIFTDSITKRTLAFRNLKVGGVIHNKSTTFRVDNMPYGGIKDSGFGREGVKYAILDYMEPKLLVR